MRYGKVQKEKKQSVMNVPVQTRPVVQGNQGELKVLKQLTDKEKKHLVHTTRTKMHAVVDKL